MVKGIPKPLELLAILALRETLGVLMVGDEVNFDEENMEIVEVDVQDTPIELDPAANTPDTANEPDPVPNTQDTPMEPDPETDSEENQTPSTNNPPDAAGNDEALEDNDHFGNVDPTCSMLYDPLRPQGFDTGFAEMSGNGPSGASADCQDYDGAVIQTTAIMKEFVPRRQTDQPNPDSDHAEPGCSNTALTNPDSGDLVQGGNAKENAENTSTIVWKPGNLILDAMFADDKNAEAWKAKLIAKFLPPMIDSDEVPVPERPCGQIEILTADFSTSHPQFLCIAA